MKESCPVPATLRLCQPTAGLMDEAQVDKFVGPHKQSVAGIHFTV